MIRVNSILKILLIDFRIVGTIILVQWIMQMFLFKNFEKSITYSIIFRIISNPLCAIKIEGRRIEGETVSCESLNCAPLSRCNNKKFVFEKNRILFEKLEYE